MLGLFQAGYHVLAPFGENIRYGEVDLFAIYCPETAGVYLVPIEDLLLRWGER